MKELSERLNRIQEQIETLKTNSPTDFSHTGDHKKKILETVRKVQNKTNDVFESLISVIITAYPKFKAIDAPEKIFEHISTPENLATNDICDGVPLAPEAILKAGCTMKIKINLLYEWASRETTRTDEIVTTLEAFVRESAAVVPSFTAFVEKARNRKKTVLSAGATRKNTTTARTNEIFSKAQEKWVQKGNEFFLKNREWHDIVAEAIARQNEGVSDTTLIAYRKRVEKLLRENTGEMDPKLITSRQF